LEELSTLGNDPPRSEIEVRQAVEVVSDVLNEVKTLVTDPERAGNPGYENEIPFSVLAEAAADAIISIDDQSTIGYVNPAAGRMFGYEPGEMVGKNLACLMPEHLRQIHLASVKRYITKGEKHINWVAVELTGLHKSGQEFPIEVSFAEDIRNGRHFFTGFVRDVTARKRSEEALRASERRLQDILDNSTAVVSVKDLEFRYILVNREYERQFHVQRHQIRGKTAYDIHPRHVAESVQANDRQVIEAGSPIQYEVAIPTAEGERHYVVVKFLLQGYAQKPYAICGIATDITELKRAEELQARRARQAALRADIHAAFSVGTEGALPTMLQRSAEAIVRHLDAAFARIWTLDDRQSLLELRASAGLYTHLDGEHARVAVGDLKIGLIAQERKPHLTNDVPNDNRISHPEWAKQEGMVAFAGYPLLVEGRLLGVLAMFARRQLPQDTFESLEMVADAVAQGIERKRAEEKLARLNRTLKTLYECNQALVHATEEYELLRSVCRILVEVGGLRMAWVGYKVFDKEKTVLPVAQAGYEDGYLERINITWAGSERGRGPTGTAIRTGTVSSNRDILRDPQMAPWRTEALRRGYASSIALPLMSGGEAFGALALYAEERDAFKESTVKQYTDLANNLAYGVIALRTREERARSEEALRESERRLQDIIDNTTSIIFVKDLELRYLLVNREYERRHEVRREEIRGKTDFDIHPQAVAEAVRANDRRVIEIGEPIQFEESVPSGGSVRHYVVVKFLLRDRVDKPYAVCGIATDITALKRTEELQVRRAHQAALRADIHAALSSGGTESALQTILQLTAEAVVRHLDVAFARIWTLNDQRNVLELQASACQYGRSEAEPARVPIGKLGVGLTAQLLRPYVTNDILKDERIEHPEWAKREGMVAFAGYPLIVDRRLVGVLGTFARKAFEPDLLEGLASVADTIAQGIERRLAVNQLRTREAELAHATRVMTMGEVTSSIAHEVNQPLGAIINYANACLRLLKGGSGDLTGIMTALSAVVKDAERAAAVIARVRALAKKSPPEMVAVEVSDIISDVVALVRRELTERRIELVTDLYSDLPPILGDRVQLQQVLLNLIMNSIEAMRNVPEEHRQLFIGARSHLEEDKRFVLITVRDSGVGLKSGQISRLFETFYTTKANGMGMGLAISRSIIEGHGGRLWAKPNAGQGAIFQFTLPAGT
jgi:PAS domain S-box-containing protein